MTLSVQVAHVQVTPTGAAEGRRGRLCTTSQHPGHLGEPGWLVCLSENSPTTMKRTLLTILMLSALPTDAQESGQPILTSEQEQQELDRRNAVRAAIKAELALRQRPVAEPAQPSQTAAQAAYDAAYAEARAKYPDLNNANSALSRELNRRHAIVVAANDPRMSNPRFVIALADASYATLVAQSAPAEAEAARDRATAIRQMERAMRTRKPDDEAKAMRMLATSAPDMMPTFNQFLAAKSRDTIQRQNDQIIRQQREQATQQWEQQEQLNQILRQQQAEAIRQQQQARHRALIEDAKRRR